MLNLCGRLLTCMGDKGTMLGCWGTNFNSCSSKYSNTQ